MSSVTSGRALSRVLQLASQYRILPNWWLRRKTNDAVAVNMLPCEIDWEECKFEIVRGRQADIDRKYAPSQGPSAVAMQFLRGPATLSQAITSSKCAV